MKSAFKEVRTEVANLNSYIQERLTGMKIVQLFSREKIEYNHFKEINQKHKKAWVRTVWYNSIFFPIAELVPSIALGFVVWYGGNDMLSSGSTSSGEIIGFIMMNQMLFRPLRQIADKFNTLQMGMVAADRVFKIIDEEEGENQSPKTKNDIDIPSLTKTNLKFIKLQGNIKFKNVHFSYVENEEVLKGINFEVKKGQTVAVVGSTGAGKSTIINLLNRFYSINSGEITLDDYNIYNLDLKNLRKQIAVVLQDVF
jgi:subfamily B ATP-binding cassette protein MsbA